MIIFHIGLPKTATTMLQYRVFNSAFKGRYYHRSVGGGEWLCRAIEANLHEDEPIPDKAIETLKAMPRDEPTMISDEVICFRAHAFWDKPATSMGRVVSGLSELSERTGQTFRILIGVRRQDDWLASWYAQSARGAKHFSQKHFGQKTADPDFMASSSPSVGWLYYDQLRALFNDGFGAANVGFYTAEALDRTPESELTRLNEFCQNSDLWPAYQRSVEAGKGMRPNQTSFAPSTWEMKGGQGDLRLTDESRRAIMRHFSGANARFIAATGLSFG